MKKNTYCHIVSTKIVPASRVILHSVVILERGTHVVPFTGPIDTRKEETRNS